MADKSEHGRVDDVMLSWNQAIAEHKPKYPFQPGTRRRVPGLGWITDDAGTITPEMTKKLLEDTNAE